MNLACVRATTQLLFMGPSAFSISVYVRGEAFLAAHQGAEAATEFRKILDHRGIVISDPIGALARLQLGRAFALSGDKSKAKTAYEDFLTLWKDADRDIPVLKQAQAEYAENPLKLDPLKNVYRTRPHLSFGSRVL